MFGNIRYVFWIIATIALNYSSIPFALWLAKSNEVSFPAKELVAIILVLLVNIGTIQMFLAIYHKQSKNYIFGLYAIMGMIVSFLVLAQLKTITYFIVVLSISIIVSAVLLFLLQKEIKKNKAMAQVQKENEYKRPNPKPLPESKPKKKKRKKRVKPTQR